MAKINNITLSNKNLVYPPPTSTANPLLSEELAQQWLIESDPLKLLANETNSDKFRLRQRYALLTFWFNTGSFTWTNLSGWLVQKDECKWFGITCNATKPGVGAGLQNSVPVINLTANNIHGTISPDLGLLTTLVSVDFNNNYLTGSLPTSISNWTALQSFFISYSGKGGLTGTLPSPIGQWTDLQSFAINYNSLTGTLLHPRFWVSGQLCNPLRSPKIY